jgi:hypothetical protein
MKTQSKVKGKAKVAVLEVSDDVFDSDASPTQSRYKQCVSLSCVYKFIHHGA